MSIETSLELTTILQEIENYCSSSLAKEQIRNTQPSFDRLVIQRDRTYAEEALAICVKNGKMPFPGLHNLTDLLKNAEKGRTLSPQDFLNVLKFLRCVKEIISFEQSVSEVEHTSIAELVHTLVQHSALEKLLNQCFNEYGEVKDTATPELRSIRSQMRNIDGEIASVAANFIARHANSVVDGIVTYRADRAVVLVKASEKNTFGGMVYGDSGSHQATYIEPPSFVAVNNKKQALLERESEEIHKVLVKCSKELQKVAHEEEANLETVTLLDVIFAKAEWGKERNACVAKMSEGRELSILRARHPLIDPAKVVSNTYHIPEDKTVLLITGPNTGGKTVSMKIIGLFVLMTYAGIPLTADEAVIPYFDRVFADIGDDQSVVSSLSSFSAHMTKQAEVTRDATSRSLVLLDEVGSGTDPQEGEALAIAILNHLREVKALSIVTTHYDRLKVYGKRHADVLVASVQFDMEKLMPTYRYYEGMTGQSNAFEVAERYGLPKSIVKYARYLKKQARTQEDELIERLEKQLNEAQLKQDELEKKIAENEALAKKLARDADRLEKEKETFKQKAEKEANDYLDSVRHEAKAILKDIRKRQENTKYHEALDAVKALNQLGNEQEEDEEEQNFTYKVGDAVELKGNSNVCEVIAVNKKNITILMNGRQVRVKSNQIRPSIHVLPKMKKQNHVSIHSSRNIFASMPQEVNLIGLHVDEAMDKMDSYMDQASLNGLKNFRIIHGDGSGKLRKAVHESLKKNNGVKEFRLGMPQEGGTGVTIVQMK